MSEMIIPNGNQWPVGRDEHTPTYKELEKAFGGSEEYQGL